MDLNIILEKGGPFVAAIISASVAGWATTRKQKDDSIQAERKYLQEERERIQKYIDEQLDEMKLERAKLIEELGKTRERVAVLEDHIRKLEYNKNRAIARLQHENEALRASNTKLISELSQCRLKN
jgi:seryl-tRNA synthetase